MVVVLFVTVYSVSAQASSGVQGYPTRGEGAGSISGYAVSSLEFSLAADPTLIGSVEFDLDAPARQVVVGFDPTPGRSFSCWNEAGYHWICELEGVYTGEVEGIQISASG